LDAVFDGWDENLHEALQGWIDQQRKAGTRRDYRRIAGRFFAFCPKRPEAVTTADIQGWRERLRSEGYAESTQRTYLAILGSFFDYLVQQGLAGSNPVQAELLPKAKPYDRGRFLSEEEVKALLGAIDVETTWGKRDYALILFLLRSGRRTGEILGLRWGDIEVTKEGAWIRWVDRLEGYKFKGCNVEGPRRAKLDWEAWAAIYRYLEGCGRLAGIEADELIFTPLTDAAGRVEKLYGKDWRKHRLSEGSVGRLIQKYARWAGLPAEEITPKALRYTAAAIKLREGRSVEQIREELGHSEVSVTQALVKALQAENAQKRASYHSQRRTCGGTIGNDNAAVLQRYLAEVLATDGLGEPIPTSGLVWMEIRALRHAIFQVVEKWNEVKDLKTAIKVLNVTVRACVGVARLMETERFLESFDPVGDDLRLERRYRELLVEEEGDAYEAVRRWLTEVIHTQWK
jgi:integrase